MSQAPVPDGWGRGCCSPTATGQGQRTGTRQGRVLPARGCSRGSSPGTAPSPAARPPAAAPPGRSTPVARASLGAAPGSGSHSQSLRVLKHHNMRTGREGKCHQHAVKKGGKEPSMAFGVCLGSTSPSPAFGVTLGRSCGCSPRSVPAAHRDHEGVPGGGEDLGTLVPVVVPLQLGQELLRLDLWDRCHLRALGGRYQGWGHGGCAPTLTHPCPGRQLSSRAHGILPPRFGLASGGW